MTEAHKVLAHAVATLAGLPAWRALARRKELRRLYHRLRAADVGFLAARRLCRQAAAAARAVRAVDGAERGRQVDLAVQVMLK